MSNRDNKHVSVHVDTCWEYVKDNIESDKEAFRVGFITALKWVMAGQEGIVEQLEEDFDLEIVEVSQN